MGDLVLHRDENAMQGFQGSAGDVGALAHHAGTAGAVAREEAELKAAIVLARSNPRDEMAAYTKLMNSCKRPSFAEDATYQYPRGGATVKGPSVYLARSMARIWGNVRSGVRIVSMDAQYVHVKGYCHDLETNAYKECEAKFRALVQRKDKQTRETRWVQPDERDLRELVNKQGAICERNAILQTLPSDFVEDAVKAADATLEQMAQGELKTSPKDTARKMAMAYSEIGVTVEMLNEYLGHPLEQMTAEEYKTLRGIYGSVRDGNTKREEHFGPKELPAPTKPAGSAADALAAQLKPTAEAPSVPDALLDEPPPETLLDTSPHPAPANGAKPAGKPEAKTGKRP